jgi:hypothetical protein
MAREAGERRKELNPGLNMDGLDDQIPSCPSRASMIDAMQRAIMMHATDWCKIRCETLNGRSRS